MPPLRERKEDIPYLVKRFLEEAGKEFNRQIEGFSPEAMKTLLDYQWPGNVRELKNTVRRAVLLAESGTITQTYLISDTAPEPCPMLDSLSEKLDVLEELKKGSSLHEIGQKEIDNIERNIIRQALSLTGSNKSKAAKMLKIDRVTLYARLNKYGLK